MALSLHPFVSPHSTCLFKPLLNIPTPKLDTTINPQRHLKSTTARTRVSKCHAVADIRTSTVVEEDDHQALLGPSMEDEKGGERLVADYDWTEEWYPLYLTEDVPDDAPLGLTVFDKQIVLYKDGHGELHCCQDRCPHRYNFSSGNVLTRYDDKKLRALPFKSPTELSCS
ncbi:protein TIC 55, chloroplastic-like [Mangifera indica]|uniref:protein TIC 55, chloroplastic-like n=1 Tax=Mangifera indica TaxID=29780 RepID=UPI001CF97598|nr:protein TIC 55, chloroplastic-like [Mangifera indica]